MGVHNCRGCYSYIAGYCCTPDALNKCSLRSTAATDSTADRQASESGSTADGRGGEQLAWHSGRSPARNGGGQGDGRC